MPAGRVVSKGDERRPRREITLGLVRQEVVNLAGGAVVRNNGEALVVHVKNQVLTLGDATVRRQLLG